MARFVSVDTVQRWKVYKGVEGVRILHKNTWIDFLYVEMSTGCCYGQLQGGKKEYIHTST